MYDSPNLFSLTYAGLVDSTLDNDTLQYIHTDIAGVWKGPMTKSTFLTCASC